MQRDDANFSTPPDKKQSETSPNTHAAHPLRLAASCLDCAPESTRWQRPRTSGRSRACRERSCLAGRHSHTPAHHGVSSLQKLEISNLPADAHHRVIIRMANVQGARALPAATKRPSRHHRLPPNGRSVLMSASSSRLRRRSRRSRFSRSPSSTCPTRTSTAAWRTR